MVRFLLNVANYTEVAFDALPSTNGALPTASNFFVNWTESLNSAVNRAAIKVIAKALVAQDPDLWIGEDARRTIVRVRKHLRFIIVCYA